MSLQDSTTLIVEADTITPLIKRQSGCPYHKTSKLPSGYTTSKQITTNVANVAPTPMQRHDAGLDF